MKARRLMPVVAGLLLPMAGWAQVNVQPIQGTVKTVSAEDGAQVIVVADKNCRVESKAFGSLISMKGNTLVVADAASVTLYLDGSALERVTAEDNASVEFRGGWDFGPSLTLYAEDNASIKFVTDTVADTLTSGTIDFRADDYSRIATQMPFKVRGYYFATEDYGEVSVNNLIVIDTAGNRDTRQERVSYTSSRTGGKGISVVPRRRVELAYYFGFTNWGRKPFEGFGGISSTASDAADYAYGNVGMMFHYPVLNRLHYGLYLGFGVTFDHVTLSNSIVEYADGTYTAKQASSHVAAGQYTNQNNWTSSFNRFGLVLPVTFSWEPWQRKSWKFRVAAIPGVVFKTYGLQNLYSDSETTVNIQDHLSAKDMIPFMFDVRAEVKYRGVGLYAQSSLVPVQRHNSQNHYPVSLGFTFNF